MRLLITWSRIPRKILFIKKKLMFKVNNVFLRKKNVGQYFFITSRNLIVDNFSSFIANWL